MGDLDASAPNSAATAGPKRDRSRILRPFLKKLAALRQHTAQADRPSRISLGSQSFEIDPWERAIVLESLQQGDPGANGWHSLLAEAVALRAKSLLDVERLQGNGGTRQGRDIRSDIQLDAAIGFALLIEFQRAIDQMVVSGDIRRAKKLTQFRHKLSSGVCELRQYIGDSGIEEAKSQAAELLSPPGDRERAAAPTTRSAASPAEKEDQVEELDLQALLELEEELLKQGAMMRGPHEEPAPPVPVETEPVPEGSRARVLLAVLAVVTVAWLVLVAWPWMNRLEIQGFSLGDFEAIPQITEIVSRPPSLFVTVDEGQWGELTPSGRKDLIETVGRKLSQAGYSGAHFTDSEGRTVGQWLRETGVKVVKSGRSKK